MVALRNLFVPYDRMWLQFMPGTMHLTCSFTEEHEVRCASFLFEQQRAGPCEGEANDGVAYFPGGIGE